MTDKIDVTKLNFSSRVFPTAEDAELWASLTPQERHDWTARDLAEAERSGVASQEEVRSFFDSILSHTRALQA